MFFFTQQAFSSAEQIKIFQESEAADKMEDLKSLIYHRITYARGSNNTAPPAALHLIFNLMAPPACRLAINAPTCDLAVDCLLGCVSDFDAVLMQDGCSTAQCFCTFAQLQFSTCLKGHFGDLCSTGYFDFSVFTSTIDGCSSTSSFFFSSSCRRSALDPSVSVLDAASAHHLLTRFRTHVCLAASRHARPVQPCTFNFTTTCRRLFCNPPQLLCCHEHVTVAHSACQSTHTRVWLYGFLCVAVARWRSPPAALTHAGYVHAPWASWHFWGFLATLIGAAHARCSIPQRAAPLFLSVTSYFWKAGGLNKR